MEINFFLWAVISGCLATLFMDVWACIQKKAWNVPSLDYCLVGRWLQSMRRGQFLHSNIMQSEKKEYECQVGWLSHYLIGVIFSSVYLVFTKLLSIELSIFSALGFGMLTVIVPFFIMQPSFGFGFAASKTPKPWLVRSRSVVAHFSFGFGLYISFVLLGFLLNYNQQ